MFGLTIGTYDRFEELYKFMIKTKYTIHGVQQRFQNQLEEFEEVQDFRAAIEEQREHVAEPAAIR